MNISKKVRTFCVYIMFCFDSNLNMQNIHLKTLFWAIDFFFNKSLTITCPSWSTMSEVSVTKYVINIWEGIRCEIIVNSTKYQTSLLFFFFWNKRIHLIFIHVFIYLNTPTVSKFYCLLYFLQWLHGKYVALY